MMNVVINDKDLFFRFGLLKLLQQIFSLAETDYIVSDKLDATTVHDVDVIVMNFSVGETVICHQVLKKRKKKSLLIGIYPEKKILGSQDYRCVSRTVFLLLVTILSKRSQTKFILLLRVLPCREKGSMPLAV